MDRSNRKSKRTEKRLLIKFGEDSPRMVGFTGDISQAGIFIKSSKVFNPGTFLKIALTLPNNLVLDLEGHVMWAKKVPPSLHRFTKKSGMGVLIHNPPMEYIGFLSTLQK